MSKIYISGPITGIEDYMKNFDKAEKELKSVGFSVVIVNMQYRLLKYSVGGQSNRWVDELSILQGSMKHNL